MDKDQVKEWRAAKKESNQAAIKWQVWLFCGRKVCEHYVNFPTFMLPVVGFVDDVIYFLQKIYIQEDDKDEDFLYHRELIS